MTTTNVPNIPPQTVRSDLPPAEPVVTWQQAIKVLSKEVLRVAPNNKTMLPLLKEVREFIRAREPKNP